MKILDGKLVASEILTQVEMEVEKLKLATGKVPGLAVVIVGDNPASKSYVRSKHKTAGSLGIQSTVIEYGRDVSRQELGDKIDELNGRNDVHAFLVQLPLPNHLDTWEILDRIDPRKDVDRFHPVNLGMLLLKRTEIFPCTPAGIVKLLDYYNIVVAGLNAVVVGRSFIVGKPIAGMLTNRDATVTLCHSKTKDLPSLFRQADLIVAATGKVGLVSPDAVKEGAILIDVGMNYLNTREQVLEYCDESQVQRFEKKGYGITGDIHKEAFKKAAYYTPVPGGVGRMTVAMLMYNTLQLFKEQMK